MRAVGDRLHIQAFLQQQNGLIGHGPPVQLGLQLQLSVEFVGKCLEHERSHNYFLFASIMLFHSMTVKPPCNLTAAVKSSWLISQNRILTAVAEKPVSESLSYLGVSGRETDVRSARGKRYPARRRFP